MINGVNLNPNILPSAQSKPQARASEPSFVGNHEMSPEVSSAYRAYGLSTINKSPDYIRLKFNDFVNLLKLQGKVEGKDYKFEQCNDRTRWINVFDSNGQTVLRSEYDNDTQKLLCCYISTYKDGELIRKVYKDGKNRVIGIAEVYNNRDVAQSSFTKEKITYQTKAQDYIEYLKQNKIPFKVRFDKERVTVGEYDENNVLTQSTEFLKGNVYRDEFDSNEEKVKTISLLEDRTDIYTSFEKCKLKTYKTEDINPEYFTDAKITINTTPQEYINYLKQNNIKFKIKNSENKGSKRTEIKEYDEKGEENTTTTWFQETEEPERICRWELGENSRRKLEFSKDETEEWVMTF